MAAYGEEDLGSFIRSRFGASSGHELLNRDSLIIPTTERLPNLDAGESITLSDSSTLDPIGNGQSSDGRQIPLDLHTLWKLLEQMDKKTRGKNVGLSSVDGVQDTSDLLDEEVDAPKSMSTWELVVLQAVLLSLLILISILWAFCCKRRCLAVSQHRFIKST